MNENAKGLLLAIGALAEVCGEFQRQLIKNGFTEKEALLLTGQYLAVTLSNKNNQEEK